MKYLILLFLMSCTTPEGESPTELKSEPCKQLEAPRYSEQFSELVCALKKSTQNIALKNIVLAQWIHESGRGNSRLSSVFLNFGGLKFRPEMLPYANKISYEAWDGRTDYLQFESVELFIEGYWHFIDRYPYRGWDKYKNDPHGYIEFINRAGYTSVKREGNKYTYYQSVINLEDEAKSLLGD